MAFLGIFGNYSKPGPGVSKDEPPKAAPIRFFEIFFRKFSKLIQANLIFMIPTLAAAVLMVLLYLCPTHFALGIPSAGETTIQLDGWAMYVTPLPLILLSPFLAGLTFITRNFAREEHAFIWSDFWASVKNNWKYFLLNGLVLYLLYVVLSFSMIYYYNSAAREALFYVPFWLCVVVTILVVFAQYYLPVMFITFDLKFGQCCRNALIFSLAGLGRNLIITVILGALLFLISVIPVMPLTIMALLLVVILIFFSFVSYLINFTVYPVIERYLIKPYEQKLEEEKNGPKEEEPKDPIEEKYSGLFSSEPEEEEDGDEDKFVYINGKLVKKSELKPGEREIPKDQ